ncbi:hypothetical protein EVAR_7924_1 [Eumeta japonica]|uniref:Uncharacterized protein n=1 Tax=Eumeta variegata TaxID=151549 RepID=A0A4C1TV65_EUMVA|nr:hypothetical protein EVAR_7924_1 [Eumeta japonica]
MRCGDGIRFKRERVEEGEMTKGRGDMKCEKEEARKRERVIGIENEIRIEIGFVPSYQHAEDQMAEAAGEVRRDARDDLRNRDSQADRTQRFGISSYGTTGPYGSSAPGVYGPVKIDLGGVLLGSIIGFGAVIVLPKIIHALAYSYGGGYGRSEDSELLQLTDMLNKMDETLGRYNVDSRACVQRLACSYVRLANENVISGNATEFDTMLAAFSSNSLIRRMLDGTAMMSAIDEGKSSKADCELLHPKCKLDKKTVVKIITQMLPS